MNWMSWLGASIMAAAVGFLFFLFDRQLRSKPKCFYCGCEDKTRLEKMAPDKQWRCKDWPDCRGKLYEIPPVHPNCRCTVHPIDDGAGPRAVERGVIEDRDLMRELSASLPPDQRRKYIKGSWLDHVVEDEEED